MLDSEKTREQLIAELDAARKQINDSTSTEAECKKALDCCVQSDEGPLKALTRLYRLSEESIPTVLDYALDEIIRLTASAVSFICFYNESAKLLTLHAWSKNVMDICRTATKPTTYELECTGIWGEAIRTRRPILVNDMQAPHPLKRGCPEGHVPLRNFLAIPVFQGKSIVAVVAVANKQGDYAQNDIDRLELFSQGVWTLVTRKQAEETLKADRELRRFKYILNEIPIPVVLTNKAGGYEWCNDACIEFFGVQSESIWNKTPFDLFEPEYAEQIVKNNRALLEGRAGQPLMVEVVARGGDRRNAILNKSVYKDLEGEVMGLVGTLTDVTERKRAEKALRDKEEQLRTLINALPEIVCFKDGQGHWLEANSFDLDLFQLTGVDYQGKKDSDLAAFSPFYRDAFLTCEATDEIAWSVEGPSRAEETIPRPDGTPMIFDIIKIPMFYQDGQRKGLVVVGRDITARKRDEELRRQIEHIIRHDLRTSAISAISLARMLRDETNLTAQQRHLLGIFEHAGQNMLDTLDSSLELYKIETGQYQNEPEVFDCLAVLRKMIEPFAQQIQFAAVCVELLVNGQLATPDSRCHCRGEPKLLRMALQNLLVNALEASTSGGKVTMELSADKDCRIEIKNRGVVPKDIRDRFFDKYVTQGKAKGTGIGTYSAKMMVKAQGGSIEMRTSDEDNETVVTVRIPS